MTWVNELRDLIHKQLAPNEGDRFTLEDLYEFVDDFQRSHPQNRHVRETIRDQLQLLRDLDEIRFIDDEGTYENTGLSQHTA